MQTILHAYCFDMRNENEKRAYRELVERLKASHPRKMESHGHEPYYNTGTAYDGATITLETKHLWDNQWNAVAAGGKGLRLFDWAQDVAGSNVYGASDSMTRRGYYLDQTPEMIAIRKNTSKCGYCGRQEPTGKFVFCPHCIDSEYLTADQLHLTRMLPVDMIQRSRSPLTPEELAKLLPKYKEAQLYGVTERGKARIAKARAEILEKYKLKVDNAKVELDGFAWLMDRGFQPGLALYYSHTGRFCFGWRQAVDKALEPSLLAVLADFPFPYDVKMADGRIFSSRKAD